MRLAPAAVRWLAPSDRELGLAGERLAARFLAARGLRVRARRLRTASGEVDLVLADGAVLVVCEVKTARRAGLYRPGDRLHAEALARRARAARALARELGLSRSRVDLVEVVLPPRGRARTVWHADVRAPPRWSARVTGP